MRKICLIVSLLVLVSCASNKGVQMSGDTSDSSQHSLSYKLKHAQKAYDEARLDDAETAYWKITKQHPKVKEAWLKLGNVYVRQGRLPAAIRCFETAINIDDKDGRAWYNLALTRMKQAMNTLEKAEQVVPLESEHHIYLLDLHTRLAKKVAR